MMIEKNVQKIAAVYFLKNNLLQFNAFRKKYDPSVYVIPPHITIISPVDAISENDFIEHVENVIKGVKSFPIHLNGVTKTSDKLLFLMVKEGNEELINLHNSLYTGILAPFLPSDFDFSPHVTVGDFENKSAEVFEAAYKEACVLDMDMKEIVNEITIVKGNGIQPISIIKSIVLK